MEEKPIKPLDAYAIGEIPRRQKSASHTVAINGTIENAHTKDVDASNGHRTANASDVESSIRKRAASDAVEDDGPASKRGKTTHKGKGPADDVVIVLDDKIDGSIVIDDD